MATVSALALSLAALPSNPAMAQQSASVAPDTSTLSLERALATPLCVRPMSAPIPHWG